MVISVTVLTFSHPPVVLGPVVQRTPQAFETWHCLVQSHPDTCLRERQPAHCVNELFFYILSVASQPKKKEKPKITAGAFTRTTSCSDRDIASKHNNCFSLCSPVTLFNKTRSVYHVGAAPTISLFAEIAGGSESKNEWGTCKHTHKPKRASCWPRLIHINSTCF